MGAPPGPPRRGAGRAGGSAGEVGGHGVGALARAAELVRPLEELGPIVPVLGPSRGQGRARRWRTAMRPWALSVVVTVGGSPHGSGAASKRQDGGEFRPFKRGPDQGGDGTWPALTPRRPGEGQGSGTGPHRPRRREFNANAALALVLRLAPR